MKRGQITLFLIVAVVLILIVGFFMTLASKVSEDVNVKDVVVTQEQITAVTSAMEDCLDKAASDGLELIGKQGGIIYKHQAHGEKDLKYELSPKVCSYDYGGQDPNFCNDDPNPPSPPSILSKYGYFTIPYVDIHGKLFAVSYGIIPQTVSNPPGYPYPGKLKPEPGLSSIFQQEYSDPDRLPMQGSLPALCSLDGPNAPFEDFEKNTCETYDDKNNIQTYLQKFVRSNVSACVKSKLDSEIFSGFGVKYDPSSKPDVEVSIGETDVSFSMKYPVSFGTGTKLIDFTIKKNVRLKYIYEFITHLFEQDIKNVFFDMVYDSASVKTCRNPWPNEDYVNCKRDGLEILRYKDYCLTNDDCSDLGKHSDLYIVTDKRSQNKGEDYKFIFAVKNRRPALDLIHENIPTNLQEKYDILGSPGNKLVISPAGYDPDDEFESGDCIQENQKCMDKTYSYSGWKADYEEKFEFDSSDNLKIIGIKNGQSLSCNSDFIMPGVDNDCLPQHEISTCEIGSCEQGDLSENEWENSCEFLGGNKDVHNNDCSNVEPKGTKRIASIIPDDTDIGPHEVKVIIRDSSGKEDYQWVKIYIEPITGGGSSNNGMDDGYASYEDPFTMQLDNKPEVTYDSYEWWDLNGQSSNDVDLGTSNKENAEFELPYDDGTFPHATQDGMTKEEYFIRNPFDYKFDDVNLLTSNIYEGDHRLELKGVNGDSESPIGTFPLYMYECLPVSMGGGDYDVKMYPYQGQGVGDIFKTDHICCKGTGTNAYDDDGNPIQGWGTYVKENDNQKCYELKKAYSFYELKNKAGYGNGQFNNEISPADKAVTEQVNSLTDANVNLKITSARGVNTIVPEDYSSELNNDIVKRDYYQKCSGERGNVCSGDVSDTGTLIKCGDFDSSKGEDESCFGPCGPDCNKDNIASYDGIIGDGEDPLGCYEYETQYGSDGTVTQLHSFSLDFLREGEGAYDGGEFAPPDIPNGPVIDGICNPTPRCSLSFSTYDDDDGQYLNYGTCGNGGCKEGWNIEKCDNNDAYGYDASGKGQGGNDKYFYYTQSCIKDTSEDYCGFPADGSYTNLDNNVDLCAGAAEGEYNPSLPSGVSVLFCDTDEGSCVMPGYGNFGEYTYGSNNPQCCGDDNGETQVLGDCHSSIENSNFNNNYCCSTSNSYGNSESDLSVCISQDECCSINNFKIELVGCALNDGTCNSNDNLLVGIKGIDCGNYLVQIDAVSDDGKCHITYVKDSSWSGINNGESSLNFNGEQTGFSWQVPSIPPKCKNKKMNLTVLGLYAYDSNHGTITHPVFFKNINGVTFNLGE